MSQTYAFTVPYADVKTMLYAASYGQSQPLTTFIIDRMFETIGKLLSPVLVRIDQGPDVPGLSLEVTLPRYEPRHEIIRHRAMETRKVVTVELHEREWSRA